MPYYNKYKKLRKYYDGVPVEPAEYQKGDYIGTLVYESMMKCENVSYTSADTGSFYIQRVKGTTNNITFNTFTTNPFTINPHVALPSSFEGQLFKYIPETNDGNNFTFYDNRTNPQISILYLDMTYFAYDGDNMKCSFKGLKNCQSLKIKNLNTTNVTIMEQCFAECETIEEIDLTGWNTPNLTSTYNMFYGCESLTHLKLGFGWDVSNLTESYNMFHYCDNLLKITCPQSFKDYCMNENVKNYLYVGKPNFIDSIEWVIID